MLQNEFNGGVARYTANVVMFFFAIKFVRVVHFTDPERTSFAVSDVTPAYGVIPA